MLSLNDQVKVIKISLSGEDYFVLSQMYLPLVGMDSFSVYVALNNITNKDGITTVTRLLDLFNLTNVGVLENSLNKLEGIGLIKRYVSDSKGITLFECSKPLDSESFLKNPLLSTYLESAIGPIEYKGLFSSVLKSNKPGFREITKSFDEVFQTGEKTEGLFNANLKREVKDNIKVKNDKFDYVYFKLMFNSGVVADEILNSSIFEESILKVSYQYSLNEEEMFEAVNKAFTLSKNPDIEIIAKNAAYIYQHKKKSVSKVEKPVVFEVKEAVEYKEVDDEITRKLIKTIENSKPEKILAQYSGGKASIAELNNFTKLAEDNGLSDGLVNCLIIHLLSTKNGEIPGYTYLEKVAKTWLRAGIKSVADALNYMNRPIESKEKTKKTSKKVKSNPEWVKEYAEDIKQKQNEKLTDEEINAGINAGNDLFG